MNKITSAMLLISLLISCCETHAREGLSGVLGLLLDKQPVQLVDEQFNNSIGWQLTSEDNPSDVDDSDSGISLIQDGYLRVAASQDCGSPFGRAEKIITNVLDIDNIKWVIKFDYVSFDNDSAGLKLGYGGINIFVNLSERTIPFKVYDGYENLTLTIRYENGVLSAKANGKSLLSPFPEAFTVTTTEDLSSEIRVSAYASAADCYASSSVRISSIIASSLLED
ncbi:MAG: hypothetical protein ACJAYF_001356 [Arenicella sp.]|jgi:hypothetical protein